MLTPHPLTLADITNAVTGSAAAFRCIMEHQPVGGSGDKVFPATYEGGKYAMERRRLLSEPEPVECVLIDSVQSQANRIELALLEAWEAGQIPLPVISVDFAGNKLLKTLKITTLEAPHRIADALLRDSLMDGVLFRKSDTGKRIDNVDARNATALFELCPTALVFGMWDSTGPKGGGGAKFARAMVSEIVGIKATLGVKTSSRIDPAQVMLQAGPLYRTKDGGWTLNKEEAAKDKQGPIKLGKDGKPSEANHGNVMPSIVDGGVTIASAMQTTVLSLPALRRLRFPINGKSDPAVNSAARAVLAALALCGVALAQEQGYDLRSRCQLHPTGPAVWELVDAPVPGKAAAVFSLPSSSAISLLKEAVEGAKKMGLPWMEKELILKPSPQLVELVRRSQDLAAKAVPEATEAA